MADSTIPPLGWKEAILAELATVGIVPDDDAQPLAPAHYWSVWPESWEACGRVLAEYQFNWHDLWAEDDGSGLGVFAVFTRLKDCLVLHTRLVGDEPTISTLTADFPMAGRTERLTTDLFGILFTNTQDSRRWLRHNGWKKDDYPLRKGFPRAGINAEPSTGDRDYAFESIRGPGVCEIPVGPVHAGIIEPGHFRFHVAGEDILAMEERLGYVHKGIEKIAEGRDAEGLLRLAGRISGDSSVAHSWAAAMAMERAAEITPPPRAQIIRAILCERERVANHLGDMGSIANDVGFAFAHSQFGRMRELWQRDNADWFGHRLLMNTLTPGGICQDLSPSAVADMSRKVRPVQMEADRIRVMLADQPGFRNRLEGTGILPPKAAKEMGLSGYVGRASGVDRDLRRDAPYPPYNGVNVNVPVLKEGDVRARYLIRAQEIQISIDLIRQLLEQLPEGPIQTDWPTPDAHMGLGRVEGWRGEVLAYVRFSDGGVIDRYHPRDPSWLTWPALERMMVGTIVPDFPVCNKSVNGSYSGHDL